MGSRREPRVEKQLPLRIFGTDAAGQIFSEKVTTVNLSRRGIRVAGVKAKLKLDEIVGLSHAQNKSHFRIKWIGEAGTPQAGHVGLINVSPEKSFWDFELPTAQADTFQGNVKERRKFIRVKCTTPLELHPEGNAMIWAKASDLSLGGCYIEMPVPLAPGTKVKVGIWMGEKKWWASGKITNSTPGFGFGIQFFDISESDGQLLSQFIKTLKDAT